MKVLGIIIFVILLLALCVLVFFEVKALVSILRNRKKKDDIEKKGE